MNKPRLIDANELLTVLQNWYQSVKPKTPILKNGISQETPVMENISRFMRFVKDQPTAYNIDKVVEQLNFEKGVAFITLGNTGDEDYDFAYDNVMSYMNKAIEIVKKGGCDE